MRWPLAVVVAVVLLDLAIVWRWYSAPNMVVSRAALATAQSGGCREVLLVRGGGLDRLYVVDVASGKLGPQVMVGTASFAAGAMTLGSQAAVAAGQDLDTSGQHPTSPQPTLAKGYSTAVSSRDSWIGGPCMPLEDPLAARLQPAGAVHLSDGLDQMYVGTVRYSKGAFDLFTRAQVRIGVNTAGRLAFESLTGQGAAAGSPTTEVVIRFLPPAAPLSGLTPAKRVQAYDGYYGRVAKDLPLLAPARGLPGV